MAWWRLMVFDKSGQTHELFGTEDIMRGAYESGVAALQQTDGVGEKVWGVEGITNTIDRAPVELKLLVGEIRGFNLSRMY